MPESIGDLEKRLKMASSILSGAFAGSLKGLSRTRFTSSIDSYLKQDPSIHSIVRLWLNVLKMPFVPLGFSKMMILSMLRRRALKLWTRHMTNFEIHESPTSGPEQVSLNQLNRAGRRARKNETSLK